MIENLPGFRWTCFPCGSVELTFPTVRALTEHMEQDHGLSFDFWPDGQLVIDTSDLPELLEEEIGGPPGSITS